jgi:hypothetical protein
MMIVAIHGVIVVLGVLVIIRHLLTLKAAAAKPQAAGPGCVAAIT